MRAELASGDLRALYIREVAVLRDDGSDGGDLVGRTFAEALWE